MRRSSAATLAAGEYCPGGEQAASVDPGTRARAGVRGAGGRFRTVGRTATIN
jgi:hypothetical protein